MNQIQSLYYHFEPQKPETQKEEKRIWLKSVCILRVILTTDVQITQYVIRHQSINLLTEANNFPKQRTIPNDQTSLSVVKMSSMSDSMAIQRIGSGAYKQLKKKNRFIKCKVA